MDDIRPPRPGMGGYPNRSNQPNQIYNQSPVQDTNDQYQQSTPSEQGGNDYRLPESHKKSGKGKTFVLIMFILMFLISSGAAAYFYFIEMVKMQDEINDLKSTNNRLVQSVRSLEYDNRDLQNKLQLEQQNNVINEQTEAE